MSGEGDGAASREFLGPVTPTADPSVADVDPLALPRRLPHPLRMLGSAHYVAKEHIRSDSIDLPLSNDGETVHRIMTVTVYDLG